MWSEVKSNAVGGGESMEPDENGRVPRSSQGGCDNSFQKHGRLHTRQLARRFYLTTHLSFNIITHHPPASTKLR